MKNAAKELAGLRKRVSHICPICDKKFKAIRTAKYCSNACRQAAKYQRSSK